MTDPMDPMDPIAAWQDAYARVRDLVAATDPAAMEQPVPACPEWTARNLLSHMIGLGADVLAGDEPDDHNEAWTQAQVDARAEASVDDLLAEWAEIAERLPDWMREHGPRPLGDVAIHEHDLRGALERPGGRDSPGVALIRGRMADRFGGAVGDLPAIALVGDAWRWCSTGEPEDAEVVVRAGDFDLFRALTSRRSAQQLSGWTERGDVTPYLEAFGGLGTLPDPSLAE